MPAHAQTSPPPGTTAAPTPTQAPPTTTAATTTPQPLTLTPLGYIQDSTGTTFDCGDPAPGGTDIDFYTGRVQISPNPGAGQTVQYQLGAGEPLQSTTTDASGIAEADFLHITDFELIWSYQGLTATCQVILQ
jgi:hypothetical protein